MPTTKTDAAPIRNNRRTTAERCTKENRKKPMEQTETNGKIIWAEISALIKTNGKTMRAQICAHIETNGKIVFGAAHSHRRKHGVARHELADR